MIHLAGCLSCLNLLPKSIINDAQFGHVLHDPFGFRVGPGLPFASIGILDEALPVPDQLSDIKLIVEDAGAALGIAIDGAEAPGAAGRCLDTLLVQFGCYPFGRFPSDIVAEDALDHACLCIID